MALKANRVGVRSDQVDTFGRVSSKSFFKKLMDRLPVWVDLPVWKGGTEQLLPVNDDEPETSPILADIDYPDILREDQYFTYRESPTEVDGTAHITGIRGNTLVWNQILDNGNFASTSGWYPNINDNTINASANELTVTINTLGANIGIYGTKLSNRVANHKYLFKIDVYTPHATQVRFGNDSDILQRNLSTGWNTVSGIVNNSVTSKIVVCYITATSDNGFVSGETFKIRNYQCFDLTHMRLDVTVEQFRVLFPLSYYKFNSGSLLSFNGTGIKTTGKNLISHLGSRTSNGITFAYNQSTGGVSCVGTATANAYSDGTANLTNASAYSILPVGSYVLSIDYSKELTTANKPRAYFQLVYLDGTVSTAAVTVTDYEFTLDRPAYGYLRIQVPSDITVDCEVYPMIRFSDAESGFEPYTSSTTSLPISTYFPTGMKSAGTVYDELVPTKAITRIGAVDLGSLTWTYASNYKIFICDTFTGAKGTAQQTQVPNMECAIYRIGAWSEIAADETKDMAVCLLASANQLRIRNLAYTDATAFKSAMSGVYLYYELATEVVQPTMVFE